MIKKLYKDNVNTITAYVSSLKYIDEKDMKILNLVN